MKSKNAKMEIVGIALLVNNASSRYWNWKGSSNRQKCRSQVGNSDLKFALIIVIVVVIGTAKVIVTSNC